MPWRLKWQSVCGLEVNRKDCATLASWQTATARPTTPLLRCSHMGTPPLKRKSASTMHTRGWVLPSSRSRRRKALGAKAEASSSKKLPSTFSTNIDWLSWATFQTLRQWERWCLQHCFIWWAQTSPPSQRCPTGQDSWCFFNKAIARNEEPAPHAQEIQWPLKHEVAEQLVPMYQIWLIPIFWKDWPKGRHRMRMNACI